MVARLQLRPKERVLAWADDGAGRAVVASETALHAQRNPPEYSRYGWEQIEHVTYDAGVLTVDLVPQQGSASLRIPVGDAPRLPVVVRDRVTASVLIDRFVPLRGDAGVRVVARRSVDGQVAWRTVLDADLANDPAAKRSADEALNDVRAEIGEL